MNIHTEAFTVTGRVITNLAVVTIAIALTTILILITTTRPEAHPADCGPTGPLVAVMREQEVNATCTITGVIMDARIELVGGGE